MGRISFRRWIMAAMVAASAVGLTACDRDDRAPTGIRGFDKFAVAGPERVTVETVGGCTFFLPPNTGALRPGFGWGGFSTSTPETYEGVLTRVASFGTLVATPSAGTPATGRAISDCIDQLDQMRSDSNGRFAAGGHGDGASGAINASPLNDKIEVTCAVEIEGRFTARANGADIAGSANGPALILCAPNDTLANCTSPGNGDTKFQEAVVPVTRIDVNDTGLFDVTGDGGLFSALVTTCVEAAVGGDAEARAALRPGGANGARRLSRIATRNQGAP